MPTEREMAEAYIAQVENQLEQLKNNFATLETHLNECKKELKEKNNDRHKEEEND